jgi:hypothetical protein
MKTKTLASMLFPVTFVLIKCLARLLFLSNIIWFVPFFNEGSIRPCSHYINQSSEIQSDTLKFCNKNNFEDCYCKRFILPSTPPVLNYDKLSQSFTDLSPPND